MAQKIILGKTKAPGFTLVEVAVALGLLATSFLGTLTALKYNQKNKNQAQNIENSSNLQPVLSQGLENFILNVKDANKNNTQALCKLFVTSADDDVDSPLVEIKIVLEESLLKSVFPDKFWDDAFPAWTRVSCSKENQGVLTRCFKLNYSLLSEAVRKKMESLNPEVVASITPLGVDPLDPLAANSDQSKMFYPLPISKDPKKPTQVDAKKVIFKLNSELTYSPSGTESSIRKKDDTAKLLWAGDVGFCNTASGKKLSPTATGEGDPLGRTFYNSPSFDPGINPPLTVIPYKKQIQTGIADNGRIRTDLERNIEASCNEVKFRCKNDSETDRVFKPSFYVDFGLQYDSRNSIKAIPSTRIAPDFTIRQDAGLATSANGSKTDVLETKGADTDFALDDFTKSYFEFNDHFYNKYFTTTKPPADAAEMALDDKKTHQLRVRVVNANNACQEICSDDNLKSLPYKARLAYTLWDVTNKESPNGYHREYLSTNSIGCTACYMKNCSRFGLRTFGPMKEQPAEPLDASLPECAIKNTADLAQPIPVNATTAAIDATTVYTPQKSCVAASPDPTSGSLSFSFRDCSEKLPVLCFNYGRFFVAKNVSNSTVSPDRVAFADAYERCYKTGGEKAPVDRLREMYKQQGENPEFETNLKNLPVAGGDSDSVYFVNNANQGIFLAPQTTEQIKNAAQNIKVDFPSETYVWVGYRTDENFKLWAAPPISGGRNAAENEFSLFFDPNGRARLATHKEKPDVTPPVTSQIGGYVLTHHIRHRGLVPVKMVQDRSSFEFLCRKSTAPYELFKTTGKASKNQNDGISKCKQENGVFVPPTTPLGWVKALTLVAEPHSNYPHPEPSSVIPALWVGLQTDNTLVVDINGTPSSYLKDGTYLSVPPTDANVKVMCETKTGFFVSKPYDSGAEKKGCPDDAKWINTAALTGMVNKTRWLLAADDGEVFYVADP